MTNHVPFNLLSVKKWLDVFQWLESGFLSFCFELGQLKAVLYICRLTVYVTYYKSCKRDIPKQDIPPLKSQRVFFLGIEFSFIT